MVKSYDVLGNIIILKFPDKTKKSEKIKVSKALLKERKSVKTILEKQDKVKGRLRTFKIGYLVGEKNFIAEYIENNCKFKFNVETCYFSPRLSNERKEIYKQVKKNESVLVMFAGVGPFSIVIAKNSKAKKVVSLELGKDCSKYAKENVSLNKLSNVQVIQGDVKRVVKKGGLIVKGNLVSLQFDRIVMARPQLKDTFLEYAFKVIKKNGIINYYGFSRNKNEVVNDIKSDAKTFKKKIKIIRVKKAGEIAPYKFRWRVDFKVL